MSDAKTYVFGNEGSTNGILSLLAPMLQQRGLDPNLLLTMNRNNNGFGEGGWFMWIIFLFFLMGWNRNGWGNGFGGDNGGMNYPLANMLNNDTGRELLMSAIQGNATAISQLATTLNCDVNAIQSAIQGVSQQICNVGNQVGLTSQQVINAIQQGNMSVAQQLSTCCCDLKTQIASCCCDVKDSITRGNYENQIATLNQTNQLQSAINSVATGQERGFANLGYATQQQTCDIQNTINAGIQRVIDGQSAAELRELQARISKQNEDLASFKTAGIISQQLAPISGAIASLQTEVAAIKCKQPDTKVITSPEHYVPVNASINVPLTYGYGCGYGLGYNYPNYGFSTAF